LVLKKHYKKTRKDQFLAEMDDPIPWERLVAADRTAAKLAALLLAW